MYGKERGERDEVIKPWQLQAGFFHSIQFTFQLTAYTQGAHGIGDFTNKTASTRSRVANQPMVPPIAADQLGTPERQKLYISFSLKGTDEKASTWRQKERNRQVTRHNDEKRRKNTMERRKKERKHDGKTKKRLREDETKRKDGLLKRFWIFSLVRLTPSLLLLCDLSLAQTFSPTLAYT